MTSTFTFSKSKYVSGCQCPKILWMQRNMSDQFDASSVNESILATGNQVGDLAKAYYGRYVEVQFDLNNPNRFQEAAAQTKDLLNAGERTICEATFSIEPQGGKPGHYCMVDILRVRDNGDFDITEVKSSTQVKEQHMDDLAYQCWVVQQCGYKVATASLMHINNKYVRKGTLDIQQLFEVEDCSSEVFKMLRTEEAGTLQSRVSSNIEEIAAIATAVEEPAIIIGNHCTKPYACGYKQWCWREESFPDDADLDSVRPSINHRIIQEFLKELSYPLYFLDFETFTEAVPSLDGQKPYQQITTQYSLHWIEEEGGPINHTEFLGEPGTDTRRAVAEQLCKDIPNDVCVLAWNRAFEMGRIREMAQLFPDLELHLMAIHDHVEDLIVPFRQRGYYHPRMHGSCSIKAVLPAMFPNNPELDYHSLEGVHHGGEAVDAFKRLVHLGPEEQAVVRQQLLKYCELDTLAMVRIWERLCDYAEGADICES